MALIQEYFDLTKRYQDEYGNNTILLMQVGSFFEVYGIYNNKTESITGSKIIDFSQICELNIVEKNTCVGSDNVMMAGFKDMQIEKYIAKFCTNLQVKNVQNLFTNYSLLVFRIYINFAPAGSGSAFILPDLIYSSL